MSWSSRRDCGSGPCGRFGQQVRAKPAVLIPTLTVSHATLTAFRFVFDAGLTPNALDCDAAGVACDRLATSAAPSNGTGARARPVLRLPELPPARVERIQQIGRPILQPSASRIARWVLIARSCRPLASDHTLGRLGLPRLCCRCGDCWHDPRQCRRSRSPRDPAEPWIRRSKQSLSSLSAGFETTWRTTLPQKRAWTTRRSCGSTSYPGLEPGAYSN